MEPIGPSFFRTYCVLVSLFSDDEEEEDNANADNVLLLVVVIIVVLLVLRLGTKSSEDDDNGNAILVLGDTVPMVFTLKAETNNNDTEDDEDGMIPTSRCSINAEMSIRSLVDDDMVNKNK